MADLQNFLPFDLSSLGGLLPTLQDALSNLAQNLTPQEIAIIASLVFALILVLRAKVVLHLFLWIAAGIIIALIGAIVFGVVNL